ncbi:MAG: hypothetical protein K2K21_14560 [Lachnospiraceae bacterium]|nr:hypothetical protein [Lachnospiraceae bacterium]
MNKKQSNSSINRQLKEMLHLPEEPVNREQIKQISRSVEPLLEEKHKRRRINYPAFLKRQLLFIGWPIWLMQGIAMILLCMVFIGPLNFYLEDSIKGIAFLLCCLSVLVLLSSVPIIHRSIRYKMYEIELSTRFSAVKLLLAKLLLIGIGNLVLLSMVFLLTIANTPLQTESALLYLLLPYLTACCGSLYLLGHIPADKFEVYSIGLCCLMLTAFTILSRFYSNFFIKTFSSGWLLVCLLLVLFIIKQLRYIMYRSSYAQIA